jgi:hypothetical protein
MIAAATFRRLSLIPRGANACGAISVLFSREIHHPIFDRVPRFHLRRCVLISRRITFVSDFVTRACHKVSHRRLLDIRIIPDRRAADTVTPRNHPGSAAVFAHPLAAIHCNRCSG